MVEPAMPTPQQLARWLPAELRQMLDTLRAAAGAVHLVGGTVRDLLFGGRPADFDLACGLDAAALRALLDARGWFGCTGRFEDSIGVANLLTAERRAVSVSAFRSESDYAADRRPRWVAFGVDLATDALRRDFTVNALYLRWPDATLHDPVGGRADLVDRRLRVIGAAAERLAEDPLRVLRGLRFAAGCRLRPTAGTAAALRATAPLCARLAAGRCWTELTATLQGPGGAQGLQLLHDFGVLGVLVEELDAEFATHHARRGRALRAVQGAGAAPAWAAAALGAPARRLDAALARLDAPRRVRRDAVALLAFAAAPAASDPVTLLRGVPAAVCAAALPALVGAGRATRALALLGGAVRADELTAAGVPRGPLLGAALAEVRRRLAAGTGAPAPATRAALIRDVAREVVKGDGPAGR